MLDIVGKRYIFFLISLLIIIPGTLSLLIFGLKVGIDFTGGTYWEVIPKSTSIGTNTVAQLLKTNGHPEAAVQNAQIPATGRPPTDTLVMRLANISPEEKDRLIKLLVDNGIVAGGVETTTVASTAPLTATATLTTTTTPQAAGTTTTTITRFDSDREIQFNTVGGTVGSEVTAQAIEAVFFASVGILIYLYYAFRRVPNAVRYGMCALIALLHDVLVVVGIFSILGQLFNVEVDSLFITAMLTVIGFSVHDTIVVFDRIRENLLKRRFDTFDKVVNYSLVQTLTRSINTSLTVIFTLFALFLFGGVSIHTFVLALLVGIISGTYSSIFNASLLLVVWEHQEWRTWFGGGRRAAEARTRPA
ncbi:MAG TPA: protein translocase subunit SecF [Chloroflexia bacterium]|nr:protein translocase subunit SecF [Chloroflexia bacterium]